MIAVVTGASSGFGYEICRLLLSKGHTVYGLSRRGTAPEGVYGISADLTQKEAVDNAFRKILQQEGQIDLLVNNAGMGISGPLEFASEESVNHIWQVNFLGTLYCTQAALPAMRAQHNGRIVFVSSVAGEIAIPYQAMYSSVKAAITASALALHNEVRDFGIRVCVVEPGDAKTGFTDAREKESAHDDIYQRNSSATNAMERDERSGMTAAFVARHIVRVALCRYPAVVYPIGGKYRLFLRLFRLLPRRLSYWIVGKMYC